MAIAHVHVLAVLSREANRDPLVAVHRALVQVLKVPAGDPTVFATELAPMENRGVQGGRPASEVDVSFEVDV
jgi:hypothetical protein